MRSEWIFMADIWLHRKQELIRIINQVTDTDHDDLDMSVVLNVLWTVEDEERDHLNAVLTGMITGSFDDSHYSRAFLEQLDLICGVPIKVDDYHEEDDDSEEPELEYDDTEDNGTKFTIMSNEESSPASSDELVVTINVLDNSPVLFFTNDV
jgi:hypothetical protein